MIDIMTERENGVESIANKEGPPQFQLNLKGSN